MSAVSRAWRVAAVALTLLTVGGAVWCARLPWQPRVDFDVIGFLWLLENVPNLMVVFLAVLCGTGALYCWLRYAGVELGLPWLR